MALTDAQKIDVVRWSGYSVGGDDQANIETQLDALGVIAEQTLTDRFMTPLETLEAALITVGDNLDTKIAGPWTANDRELSQRTALYNQTRRAMVAFLGFAPGPALGVGGNNIALVRC